VNAVSIIPVGTVTFLFTDLEGSTRSWEQQGPAMSKALARHDAIVRTACAGNNGYVFKTLGDAFCVAFGAAHDALAAAIDLQLGLLAQDWQAMGMATPLSLRLALHTGPVETRDGDYFGQTLNRTSRLLATAHGGQSLLSESTAVMVREYLLGNMTLKGLGEHRLKDLQRPESVYQLVCPPLPVDFPPLRSLEGRPHNLPLQLTLFVGRETALADAAMRLRDPGTRLLTLLGPGGTGKTRIALQLAAECLDDFTDGAFFVTLDSVRDTEHVAMAIASALGLKEGGGSQVRGAVDDFLASRNLLLVLDNFEQVVEAAPLVSELLRGAAGLKVVVTSREALRVPGERVLAVSPLELPSIDHLPSLDRMVQFEAVRLFIDRATLVKADFTVTNENAPAVAQICHRLDGLPLAIELAASRVRVFAPGALLLRLDRGLGLTLTGSSRGLSARQQTLKGAIAWSVDLLTPDERTLFTRLSVFMGGFTLEAAEHVAADPGEPGMIGDLDVLSGIEGLADKSLLHTSDGIDGEPRFRMLETIRDHSMGMASELGIAGSLGDRHLAWITDLFTGTEDASYRAGGSVILDRLHAELGNLRQALAWASAVPVDGARATLGLRLLVEGVAYWQVRHDPVEGLFEIQRLLSLVDPLVAGLIASPDGIHPAPANILSHARITAGAFSSILTSETTWLRPALEDAVTHVRSVGDKRGEGRALLQLAWSISRVTGFGIETSRVALEAISAANVAGDQATISSSHGVLALTELRAGRDGEAWKRFSLALEIAEASGNSWQTIQRRRTLGWFLCNVRRWDEGEPYLATATGPGITRYRESLYAQSYIALATGNHPRAHAVLAEWSALIASGHLPSSGTPVALVIQGHLARLENRMEGATDCFRSILATPGVSENLVFTHSAHLGLAMIDHETGNVAGSRRLFTKLVNTFMQLPELMGSSLGWMTAEIAGLVAPADPARGLELGAIADHLGQRAWYAPRFSPDVERTTKILHLARERSGHAIRTVPVDLPEGEIVAKCLEALASLEHHP